MTQEQINILLAFMTVVGMPILSFLIPKWLNRHKDKSDYSGDLLELANRATEALKKAREDLTASEAEYEKTIDVQREAHTAALEAVRVELNARINRQKARIEELEQVTKIYKVSFDLVTHPNIEIKNPEVRALDDVTASQKIRAIAEGKDAPK